MTTTYMSLVIDRDESKKKLLNPLLRNVVKWSDTL